MSNVKTCNNCDWATGCVAPPLHLPEDAITCDNWKKIPCPSCGGMMSELREHNGTKYRHCYACHSEFEEVF